MRQCLPGLRTDAPNRRDAEPSFTLRSWPDGCTGFPRTPGDKHQQEKANSTSVSKLRAELLEYPAPQPIIEPTRTFWSRSETKMRLTLCKLCGILLCGLGLGAGVETILPEVSAPAPIVSRYFPDRVHDFVWRTPPEKQNPLLPLAGRRGCRLLPISLCAT
jgi:hypothetical protein